MKQLGTLGAAIILVAFVGNELSYWNSQSLIFDLLNSVGSGILLLYAAKIRSVPFAVLNVVWLMFALKDIVIRL